MDLLPLGHGDFVIGGQPQRCPVVQRLTAMRQVGTLIEEVVAHTSA